MNDCFILLAAGKGKRFNSKIPKQYVNYKNKPLFLHSLDKAIESKMFKKIILVLDKKYKNIKKNKVSIIKGGKERFISSQKASYTFSRFSSVSISMKSIIIIPPILRILNCSTTLVLASRLVFKAVFYIFILSFNNNIHSPPKIVRNIFFI